MCEGIRWMGRHPAVGVREQVSLVQYFKKLYFRVDLGYRNIPYVKGTGTYIRRIALVAKVAILCTHNLMHT